METKLGHLAHANMSNLLFGMWRIILQSLDKRSHNFIFSMLKRYYYLVNPLCAMAAQGVKTVSTPIDYLPRFIPLSLMMVVSSVCYIGMTTQAWKSYTLQACASNDLTHQQICSSRERWWIFLFAIKLELLKTTQWAVAPSTLVGPPPLPPLPPDRAHRRTF